MAPNSRHKGRHTHFNHLLIYYNYPPTLPKYTPAALYAISFLLFKVLLRGELWMRMLIKLLSSFDGGYIHQESYYYFNGTLVI